MEAATVPEQTEPWTSAVTIQVARETLAIGARKTQDLQKEHSQITDTFHPVQICQNLDFLVKNKVRIADQLIYQFTLDQVIKSPQTDQE